MDPAIIQQLAQMSPGDGEVTLVRNRLELLTQKKIICTFENFVFGMKDSFTVEVDATDNRRASSWTFTLAPPGSSGNSTFAYARVGDSSCRRYNERSYQYEYIQSDGEQNVWHYVEASILDKNCKQVGTTFKSVLGEISSFDQKEIFQINKDTFDMPTITSDNGCLVVEATLKFLRKVPTEKKLMEKNGIDNGAPVVKSKPLADFRAFLNSKDHSDFKITAKDGKEFYAHKLVLRVRSKVFDAMFKSEMSESSTGIVKLDDMSAGAVNFLLTYIYCGDILSFSFNGKTVDGVFQEANASHLAGSQIPVTAEEALYVASKYNLKEVLVFIGHTFWRLCSEENARDLLELSKMYSLDCKELIGKFIMDRPNIMREVLEL